SWSAPRAGGARRSAAWRRARRPRRTSAALAASSAGIVRSGIRRPSPAARTDTIHAMATIDVPQSLENLKLERDAIALYDELARIEKDPRRAEAFRTIAGNERRHADVWAGKLRELGATVPEPDGPRLRIRTIVLIAGIAGLLAGSFSMAAGEYISMQSQRELFERQIALERAELEAMPREEQAELAQVYRSKGFTEAEAATIAERMFRDPEHALD